jgi:hypothetical protein
MIGLRQRLVRAWDQSRIRLPRKPLYSGEIQPGDLVQIESSLWRVKARQGQSTLLLETGEGRFSNAILRTSENSFWILQKGAEYSRLYPSMVIVYPVALTGAPEQ